MKLSVIVPVYNVEQYLDKCLDSLVNQTLKDIEIIVVNDASPDNSKKIINKYMKKYKNIKYYEKENGGQGSARNLGLKYATGEFVAYVDSDDYVDYDMFEKMYNKAKEESANVVICGHKVVDMEGKILDVLYPSIYKDATLDIIYGNMAVWNKIYKKELIDVDFREKLWYEDIDFTAKLLFNEDNVAFVDEALYNYLLRPGSTMNNTNVKRNLELLPAFDSMISYFEDKSVLNDVYDKLEFLAVYHIYIMGITRIIRINASSKVKKDIINEYKKYLKDKFPNYKDNIYLKYMSRNRKVIYRLINLKLYGIIKLIFEVRG